MKVHSLSTVRTLALAAGVVCSLLSVSRANAQLYGNDSVAVKSGDLLDRDFFRAKWDSIRLDEAIKERQPEGAILLSVIGQIQLLDELIKKYPNYEDLKTWKKHAVEIQGKISPNANRGEGFKPGSLWNELNYREAWVNYHYAKTGIDKKDWAAAKDGVSYADRNLGFLVDRVKKEDRVAAWPDGAAKWVTDTAADLVKMREQVNAKQK